MIVSMNFEQPEKVVESLLKRENRIQLELAERFYGFLPQNEQLIIWIDKNAARFKDLIQKEPSLLDAYETNHEATLATLEEELYHKHPHKEVREKNF